MRRSAPRAYCALDGRVGPCVRETRMRVVDVLELLSSGADHAEILTDYPSLEEEDILACLEYAARLTDHSVLRSA